VSPYKSPKKSPCKAKNCSPSKNSYNDEEENHIYNIPDLSKDKEKALKKLLIVSIICIVFMLTEVIGGVLSGSLAIMTDAAHLFSDVSGFFISILSIVISRLPAD
jgi:zinc transporter 2